MEKGDGAVVVVCEDDDCPCWWRMCGASGTVGVESVVVDILRL